MHQLTDTNPKIAEKKAELSWRLGMMCRKPPQSIGSAGVMKTREWLALRRRGMVLLGGGAYIGAPARRSDRSPGSL